MRGLVARSDTELLQVAALELSWRIVDSAAAAYSRFNEPGPRIRGRERHMQAAHGIHAAGTRERRREFFQYVRHTIGQKFADARAQVTRPGPPDRRFSRVFEVHGTSNTARARCRRSAATRPEDTRRVGARSCNT